MRTDATLVEWSILKTLFKHRIEITTDNILTTELAIGKIRSLIETFIRSYATDPSSIEHLCCKDVIKLIVKYLLFKYPVNEQDIENQMIPSEALPHDPLQIVNELPIDESSTMSVTNVNNASTVHLTPYRRSTRKTYTKI